LKKDEKTIEFQNFKNNHTRYMHKKILIIKNISREGPGLLEQILQNKWIGYDIIDLEWWDIFPSPVWYGALVVLGGPDSANDENMKITSELTRIQEALDIDMPYLGICLWLQTLVKAAGGTIVKSPLKEVGFRDPTWNYFSVELTSEGKEDPLFKNLTDTELNVFHLHGETVVLSENMTLLASWKYCKNQIVRVWKNAYWTQCHFELTEDMFEIWMRDDDDLQQVDKSIIQQDFIETRKNYVNVGNTLFGNFLTIAGF
jgi:GMP synthase (glutamine-hydrolysing)